MKLMLSHVIIFFYSDYIEHFILVRKFFVFLIYSIYIYKIFYLNYHKELKCLEVIFFFIKFPLFNSNISLL